MEQFALLEYYEHHLEHVGTMNVVMVFNVASVSLIDLSEETSHLLHIEQGKSLFETQTLHDVDCDGAHANFSANFLHESMDVELVRVN